MLGARLVDVDDDVDMIDVAGKLVYIELDDSRSGWADVDGRMTAD